MRHYGADKSRSKHPKQIILHVSLKLSPGKIKMRIIWVNNKNLDTNIELERRKYKKLGHKYRTGEGERTGMHPEKIHQLLMQRLGYCLFVGCNSGNGFQRGHFKRC